MLIDKHVFSATKNIQHKKPTSEKITLQVNKSKTKFDALLFEFLETSNQTLNNSGIDYC